MSHYIDLHRSTDQNPKNDTDDDSSFKMLPSYLRVHSFVQSKTNEKLDWPCNLRPKPLAYIDAKISMPGFNEYVYGQNIIDCSSKGQIATSSSLVLRGPQSQWHTEINPMKYKKENVEALKYNPDGDLLALSVNDVTSALLEIWDVSNEVALCKRKTCTFLKKVPTDGIRCIEWDPTCQHIICGMSSGLVLVISYPDMKMVHRYGGHKVAITQIKYSIHGTLIAITDSVGNLSVLLNNSNFERTLKNTRAHYIAWHPWIETMLIIGYKSPVSIHLLDLESKTTIAHYRRIDLQYTLCAMAINPVSAELVVSIAYQELTKGVIHSDILVLASMSRIVDNISGHPGAVHYIIWDPTGTKVATVGQDESLNIWHFFGEFEENDQ